MRSALYSTRSPIREHFQTFQNPCWIQLPQYLDAVQSTPGLQSDKPSIRTPEHPRAGPAVDTMAHLSKRPRTARCSRPHEFSVVARAGPREHPAALRDSAVCFGLRWSMRATKSEPESPARLRKAADRTSPAGAGPLRSSSLSRHGSLEIGTPRALARRNGARDMQRAGRSHCFR